MGAAGERQAQTQAFHEQVYHKRQGGSSPSRESPASTGRRGGVASVRGDRGDTDVQEVVGVAQVLAQPLQRRLQQGLDAVDHHLEVLLLTCAEEEEEEESTLTSLKSHSCSLQLEFCLFPSNHGASRTGLFN